MWIVENRAGYDRGTLRYPTDLTDAEWELAKAKIPPARRGGNKRTVNVREVMNGLMYVLDTGCQWRAIPKDLPPYRTVNHYLCRWQHDGTLDRLHDVLCQEQEPRKATPTIPIIDRQTVKVENGNVGSTHRASETARKSKARSDISSSTPRAC